MARQTAASAASWLLAAGRDRVAAVTCFESAADIARQQGAHPLAHRALRALDANRV